MSKVHLDSEIAFSYSLYFEFIFKMLQAKNEFNGEKKLDGNDESLIYIRGSDLNALFNFLINCRATAVTTGPLAGVPPTLLSPVAFHGGTLASLKVSTKLFIQLKLHLD